MEVIISKSDNGVDLIVEVIGIDPNNGNGIPVTGTVRIQRKSDGFEWDSSLPTPAFVTGGPFPPDTLIHDSNGMHEFVLIGGAELIYHRYWMHIVITGNPDVNINAKFSDIILAEFPLVERYPLGGVYYKDSVTNVNTVLGIDGTINNPVGSYVAAKSLADSLGSKHIIVEGLLPIDVTTNGYAFTGIVPRDSDAATASQLTISGGINWLGNTVRNLAVQTDNGTFNDNQSRYYDCEMFGANTQLGGHYRDCIWNVSNIFDIQKETIIIGGSAKGSSNSVTFNVEAVTDDLVISDLRVNEILFQNITTNNVVTLNVNQADVTLAVDCTGGTLVVIGDIKVTNNGATAIDTDLQTAIGIPYDLEDGATPTDLTQMISQLAENIATGAVYDRLIHSQQAIRERGDVAWAAAGLTSQNVRDAMKLAPTGGAPAAGSVDEHLDDIKAVTDVLASVDGVSLEDREKFTLAYVKGKIARSGNAFTYFAQNGTSSLFTLTGNTGARLPS